MNILCVFVPVIYIMIELLLTKIQHTEKPVKVIIKDSFVVLFSSILATYVYDIFYPIQQQIEQIAPVFLDKAPF